jgi:nucleoside-diphosphate-sugar epimerase
MTRRVLVTGATGLVGSETVAALSRDPDVSVTGVCRRPPEPAPGLVSWDMAAEEPPPALRGHWDVIVNAAADTRWSATAEEATRSNVDTLARLRSLVARDTHVIHVSTAYAIDIRGASSDDPRDYRNNYEWSKSRAERVARELFPRLTIVRPPLIIGCRDSGRAARFAGMYTILRGITASTVPVVVGVPDAFFDVVPVDDVAALLVALVSGAEPEPGPEAEPLRIAGGPRAPRAEEALEVIVGTLNAWREERGVEPFDQPRLVDPDSWNRFFLPFARDELTPRQLRILDLLTHFHPYLAITAPLERTHPVDDVLPCVEASVRYWADSNVRVASLSPRPWTANA